MRASGEISRKGRIGLLECKLCPRFCLVAPGQSGQCRVRVNVDGKLLAVTHGFPCSVHSDPIEKKPLFHYRPGTQILSIATVGCNLACSNCQNWEISQANPEETEAYHLPPEEVVRIAVEKRCPSIAYTYTEPIVYYEYAMDTSGKAREAGIGNVLVTAGYANPDPWKRLLSVTDAANVDLKAFDDGFYREICKATLGPVLDALVMVKEAGVWLEVTNLVIPTLNDDMDLVRRMCRWHAESLGIDTPLHFSRFWPQYRLDNLPPTPESTLLEAREVARKEGLRYVYVGNVPGGDGETTFCPGCGLAVLERVGFTVTANVVKDGRCPECGTSIAGVWK